MSGDVSEIVRAFVRARDNGLCVRCGMPGTEIHHRRTKHVLDEHTHQPCNLITVCGWGNHTGCHGWAHSNPLMARQAGLIVSRYANPEEIPLELYLHDEPILLTHTGDTTTAV